MTARRIEVSQTGPATAATGGVANTGSIYGDIIVSAPPAHRSAYRDRQVTRIAPPSLMDREAELAELTRFCVAVDGERYAWWQASAWAGKSALLSWFVLNPPPGVRVISFFITARFKGQDDREAFLWNVVGQLAEILDEPMPALNEATGEVEFLDRGGRWS